MAQWIVLPGGRIVRFRNRPVRHHCGRRRRGRPALGYGPCYPLNGARHIRRASRAALRRAWSEAAELEQIIVPVVRPR